MGAIESVTYVPATPPLRPAIVDLLRSCALPVEDLAESWEHFFVARAGDRLIGSVGLQPLGDMALFRSLAVQPAWRGQGVARRLFDEARLRALQLGVRELFLLTTTAEAMFNRWGFVRIRREEAPLVVQATPECRTLCPDSAVVMRLAVRGPGAQG